MSDLDAIEGTLCGVWILVKNENLDDYLKEIGKHILNFDGLMKFNYNETHYCRTEVVLLIVHIHKINGVVFIYMI